MSIKSGTQDIIGAYLGDAPVSRIYHGDDLLWINGGVTTGTDIYFAANGNDYTGDGTMGAPFKTVQMANFVAAPGKRLWFKAGDLFLGGLKAQPNTQYNSYGGGKAIIASGLLRGFFSENGANVKCRNLEFIGLGAANKEHGIYCVNSSWYAGQLPGLEISGCVVHGYGKTGIEVEALNYPSGYSSPIVQNNEVYNCAINDLKGHTGGIIVAAEQLWGLAVRPASHDNVQVLNNYVHHNDGASGARNHTGSGIIVAQTNVGLVQGNVAEENGAGSTNQAGPVGIWAWDSIGVVMRKNYSLRQRTNGPDGAGFDLDGGCVDCVMEYNYSTGCKGPGILLFSFDDTKDWPAGHRLLDYRRNTARYNVSVRDGDNNEYSRYGLFLGTMRPVLTDYQDVWCYNNTVITDDNGENSPDCFNINTFNQVDMSHATGIVANNIFVQRGRGLMCDMRRNQMTIVGNVYYSRQGTPMRYFGFDWWDPKIWCDSPGDDGPQYGPKETMYGTFQFHYGNPYLLDDLSDDPEDLVPSWNSPVVGVGVDLNLEFGLPDITEDFLGNPIDPTMLMRTPGAFLPQPGQVNLLTAPNDLTNAAWQKRYDAFTLTGGLPGRLGGATAQKIAPNVGSKYVEVFQDRAVSGTLRRGVVVKGDDVDAVSLISQKNPFVSWFSEWINLRTGEWFSNNVQGTDYSNYYYRIHRLDNGFWMVYYDVTLTGPDQIGAFPSTIGAPDWGITGNSMRGLIFDGFFEYQINP